MLCYHNPEISPVWIYMDIPPQKFLKSWDHLQVGPVLHTPKCLQERNLFSSLAGTKPWRCSIRWSLIGLDSKLRLKTCAILSQWIISSKWFPFLKWGEFPHPTIFDGWPSCIIWDLYLFEGILPPTFQWRDWGCSKLSTKSLQSASLKLKVWNVQPPKSPSTNQQTHMKTPLKTNMTTWKIPILTRKYIDSFNSWWRFSSNRHVSVFFWGGST